MDNFNWSNLNAALEDDDSQIFFEDKHSLHEKFVNKIKIEKIPVKLDIENKENVKKSNKNIDLRQQIIKKEHLKETGTKSEDLKESGTKPKVIKPRTVTVEVPLPKQVTKKQLGTPQAYKYAKRYQEKNKQQFTKIEEEQKKARVFHSKPAPNFSKIHQNLENSRDKFVKIPTIPVTPECLRKSQEDQEKLKVKAEEYRKNIQPQPFKSRDPTVLKEEPFKIKSGEKICTKVEPFELRMTTRLQARRAYDAKYMEHFEEKLKMNEEKKRLKDEKDVKEIRKNAEFKARPNPHY